jgi:glycosyltransferase involved in cell wall biosynthesis
MKVGLIVDDLEVSRGTGIARYARELLEGLSRRGVAVTVISARPLPIPFGEAVNHTLVLPYRAWRKAAALDLVHATAPVTGLGFPFLKKPRVVTYHDLITLLSPTSGNSRHARLLARYFFKIGKYSERIIAVSSQTKEELVKHLNFPEEKIIVVNPGVDGRFRPLTEKGDVPGVIGYLGAVAPRKRLDYLIRAFAFLKNRHPALAAKLHIYGRPGRAFPEMAGLVNALHLAEYVVFGGAVPDEQLVALYNTFSVFVLPSDWEGFGIPILEAQRCGVPVIIRREAHIPPEATAGCLRAESEEDMAEKIYALLTDQLLRQRIIEAGLNHSRAFTWERMVAQTMAVYEEVLARPD